MDPQLVAGRVEHALDSKENRLLFALYWRPFADTSFVYKYSEYYFGSCFKKRIVNAIKIKISRC